VPWAGLAGRIRPSAQRPRGGCFGVTHGPVIEADRPCARSTLPCDDHMPTLLGIVAILLWSTTIAVSRSLVEEAGTLTAASATYLLSGAIGCAWLAARGRLRRAGSLPRLYLFGCGGLFVLYMVSLYAAIGLAADRSQVIGVGIVNYLWPGLTLVLSVPLLGKRAGPLLVPGAVIAFAGAALAGAQAGGSSWSAPAAGGARGLLPYAFALVAAVTWALYSNLSRRWAGEGEGGAVPLFLLASGLVLGLLRLLCPEETTWTPRALAELGYMALFSALLAYAFWDLAMRKGNIILVAALSYFTPLLSTLVSCIYLKVTPGPALWIACALVVAGAVLCRISVTDPPAASAPNVAEHD